MRGQLVEARSEAGLLAPRLELGERGVQRDAELQRRLAPAPGVEVRARAQGELLAGEHGIAAGEHGGEALLRAQRHAPQRPRLRARATARSRAPSARRRRARRRRSRSARRARATARPRASPGSAVATRWACSTRFRRATASSASASQVGRRAATSSAAARPSIATVSMSVARDVTTGAGAGPGGASRAPRRRRQQPPLRRAEEAQDEDPADALAEVLADRVAAGIRAQRPGELELDKAKPP